MLRTGPVDDPLEREADRVADALPTGMSIEPFPEMPPAVRRKCTECEVEDQAGQRPSLQRKATAISSRTAAMAPPIVHEALRTPGQPLDRATRAYFEPRFGRDFTQVRVHTDTQAAASAQAVNAGAYTVGHDIIFGTGQYRPAAQSGWKLLAHELTHVLQQRDVSASRAMGGPLLQRQPQPKSLDDVIKDAPSDTVTDWEQQGSVLTITQTLVRQGLYSRLVTIADAAPFRILSRRLFRRDDNQNPDWIEVTEQTGRAGPNIEWRMPDRRSDAEKMGEIQAPGLLYGFLPFHTMPYLKDQTLPIKDPHLRMKASALQQTLRAVSKVDADLVEFAVTSLYADLMPGAKHGMGKLLSLGMRGAKSALSPAAKASSKLTRALARVFSSAKKAGAKTARTGAKRARTGAKTATTGAKTATAEVGSRLAGRVDPEVSQAVDEAFSAGRVTTGEPIELLGHGTASRARAARQLSGRQFESAHGAARSALGNLPDYDPNAALTRLLPRTVHRNMDRFWQQEARRLVAQGRTSWTAQEMFDATAASIRRTAGLSPDEQFSHIQRLADEVFIEWGLLPGDPVRLPFGP
jgi:hypothetical protein